jgi:hypothetical protein
MPRRIVPPASELKWGLLVKSWATGKNYVAPGQPPIPLPHTYEEFKELCNNRLGLGLQLPDWMNAIVFVQPSRSALTIRLPPKEIVEENEREFEQGGLRYEIPAFYDHFYHSELDVGDTLAAKLEFHALRIGDYSISMCA